VANDQCRRMQGKVFPVRGLRRPRRGRACRRRPGPGSPPCIGVPRGLAPGSGVGDGGRGTGFAVRLPPPSCRSENTSVTASRTPGVMDQDLRRSEAWLGTRRRLAGAIRAVITSPPPQAHRHGHGRGGGILLGHGVVSGGAWYNTCLEGSVVLCVLLLSVPKINFMFVIHKHLFVVCVCVTQICGPRLYLEEL
jgi:hypothetical protein